MMLTLLWALFFQGDPVRSFEANTKLIEAKIRASDAQKQRSISEGQRSFEERFNKLIDVLRQFTAEYNASQGQVWPAKKAEALRTALRDFERALPNNKHRPATSNSGDATTDKPCSETVETGFWGAK